MYQNYNLERLNKSKEELERLIRDYQQPINTFIPSKDFIEWRILNENEEVDNLYVQNKTLFINDENMIIKDVDGKTEKWKVKKIYPIDKKDEKINELEEKIKELEGRLNESTKSTSSARKRIKSDADDDRDVESKPETGSELVSGEEQSTTG